MTVIKYSQLYSHCIPMTFQCLSWTKHGQNMGIPQGHPTAGILWVSMGMTSPRHGASGTLVPLHLSAQQHWTWRWNPPEPRPGHGEIDDVPFWQYQPVKRMTRWYLYQTLSNYIGSKVMFCRYNWNHFEMSRAQNALNGTFWMDFGWDVEDKFHP